MRLFGHLGAALVIGFMCPSISFAQTEGDVGDVKRGAQIAQTCIACHGENGYSPSPINPTIGGQHQAYLLSALKSYADETRRHTPMKEAVTGLSVKDLNDVAAYYAVQTPPPIPRDGEPITLSQNMRFTHGDRKAGYSSSLARAARYEKNTTVVRGSACTSLNLYSRQELESDPMLATRDTDDDGILDIYDAAPRDANEFARDTNGDGLYEICNIQQLQAISTFTVTFATPDQPSTFMSRNYQLAQNIDASNFLDFMPIGNCGPENDCLTSGDAHGFSGIFDGQGYVIQQLVANRPNLNGVGIFGVLAQSGLIINVNVEDALITGRDNVGGLVGANFGTIYKSNTQDVTITATQKAGGLVGGNDGLIALSSANGIVGGERGLGGLVGTMTGAVYYSHANTNVSGKRGIGGLVGLSTYGYVLSSYAMGSIFGLNNTGGLVGISTQTQIRNSYARAKVTASGESAGGLVGFHSLGVIKNSYSQSATSGNGLTGGLVGRNNGLIQFSFAKNALSNDPTSGGLVGAQLNGQEISTYWYADSLTSGKNSAASIKMLTGEDTKWSPENLPSSDWLDYFCDTNQNGFIDPDEKSSDNYIWSFGTKSDFPALRCTTDGVRAQRN